MVRQKCISDIEVGKMMVDLITVEKEGKLSVIFSLVRTMALEL